MKSTDLAAEYRKFSDLELVFRYLHKDEYIAIDFLFERYSHLVYGVCLKYFKSAEAAEKATRQIFIDLITDLKRFEVEDFKSWLYKTTHSFCNKKLHTAVQVKKNRVVYNNNIIEFENGLHEQIEKEGLLNDLEHAMFDLNKEQKSCLELFYLQGLNFDEIAAKKGIAVKEVKDIILNGRKTLKHKLETLKKKRA